MSHPLYVAFIWHQHQPLYKFRLQTLATDTQQVLGGSIVPYRLPWVRLHGTKDYLDLVVLLSRYPTLHQTVNLVPSLILQLEDYAAGRAMDPYLEVALAPTDCLNGKQRLFVIEHCFDANRHTLIDPHPRYAQLYAQRLEMGKGWCLKHWTLQDFGDALAWHSLAWFDPLFWSDPEIARWLDQGRGFSLGDRHKIWQKQREILVRILPQHREMQDQGQLEIMTSPYTHPILPLLADTQVARVGHPDLPLPRNRFLWPEDVERHLRKAWALYGDRFGRSPRGLWPSEQAVSPGILPPIARQGFQWLCSDERILGRTLGNPFHRDGRGILLEPRVLYRPYRLETGEGDLAVVFRDQRLSDLIGFTYGGMDPQRAAVDLVESLEAIAHTLNQQEIRQQEGGWTSLQNPWLVTIALDGENCWEFYSQDGKPFLEALYSRFQKHPGLKLVTVSEYLQQFPPTQTLATERLHSGSWVNGDFTTWIGDGTKNRAWELLAEARAVLAAHPDVTEESHPEVWEALDAAEGSDWFWWFGEGHSSNQDGVFDELFRRHLQTLYELLGEVVPAQLYQPVQPPAPKPDHQPQSFIHPAITGKGSGVDWSKAGWIDVGGTRGTMHQGRVVERIWYGVDRAHFYLRVDFRSGLRVGVDCAAEMHVLWFYPDRTMHNSPIPLVNVLDEEPLNYLFHHHLHIDLLTQGLRFQEAAEHYRWLPRPTRAQMEIDRCLELAVPWADLSAEPDWALRLLVVLADGGRFREYFPEGRLVPIGMA